MAESKFQLRCYSYLDRMQPQYAAFVGTITQGDLPVEGMASLYIEVAPGNEVFQLVDIAVKSTEARPGAQIVERVRWLAENVETARLETLTGELAGFHKLRVGDYRVIYLILHDEQTLVINAVGHRREIYRKR